MPQQPDWIVGLLTAMTSAALNVLLVATPFTILELAWPRGQRISLESRLRSGVFWVLWIVVGTLLVAPLSWLIGHVKFRPLITDLTPPFISGFPATLVAGAAAVLLADFVQYWVHRAQHSIPVLWRFHSVHHSIRELGAISYYRHIGETVINVVIYLVPMAIITSYGSPLPYLVFLLGLHGTYLHSANGLHFGWGNRILIDNRFHRIHHSLEQAHINKNFTNQCPIWDWMFGTAYFPKADEWPATGVDDQPEPQTIIEFLVQPFLRRVPQRAPDLVEAN